MLFFGLVYISCTSQKDNFESYLPSPDARIHIYFYLNNGEPYYLIFSNDEIIIDWSLLGFQLSENIDLTTDLVLVDTRTGMDTFEDATLDTTFINGDYNEITFCLEKQNEPLVGFNIVMRAYNKGIAFRYVLTGGDIEKNYQLLSEETWFSLYSDTFTWDKIQDTLEIPVTLTANQKFEVILDETKVSGYPESVFVKYEEETHRFRSYFGHHSGNNAIIFENGLKSPWRIITINEIINKKKDE